MNNSDDISRKLLAAERAAALTSLLESHDAHVAKKRLEVVVLGLNVVDVLVRLPGKVRPGEKYEVRDLTLQGGAPAGNAACGLAMLGWRVGFVARLSDNTLSEVSKAELSRCGVSADLLIHDPAAGPAVAVVEINPAGERTVFYSLNGYRSLGAGDVPSDAIQQAKLLLVDGYETEAALAALQAANGSGCASVVDVEAGDPAVLRQIIALAGHAILPLVAARELTDEAEPEAALRILHTWTGGQVAVTDGARGSWALDAEGHLLHQPAFPVEVVDTTGCGDAFHAAYASALLDGLDLSMRLEFAAWFASRVALSLGGRTNLPTRLSLRDGDLSPLSEHLRAHLLGNFDAENVAKSPGLSQTSNASQESPFS